MRQKVTYYGSYWLESENYEGNGFTQQETVKDILWDHRNGYALSGLRTEETSLNGWEIRKIPQKESKSTSIQPKL